MSKQYNKMKGRSIQKLKKNKKVLTFLQKQIILNTSFADAEVCSTALANRCGGKR